MLIQTAEAVLPRFHRNVRMIYLLSYSVKSLTFPLLLLCFFIRARYIYVKTLTPHSLLYSYPQYDRPITSECGFPDSGIWPLGGHWHYRQLYPHKQWVKVPWAKECNELECHNTCFDEGIKEWNLGDLQVMKSKVFATANKAWQV